MPASVEDKLPCMASFLTLCPASENVAKVDNSISWVIVGDVGRPSLPERHLCNVLAHPGEGKEVEKGSNQDFWSDLSRRLLWVH